MAGSKRKDTIPMPELEDEKVYGLEGVYNEAKIEGENCFLVKWKSWLSEYNQ